jgi:putative FmdB family regulatory protein
VPIYEYQCKDCGHEFEYLVLPASPESEAECPNCRRRDLQRLISMCAVSSENTRQAHLDSARKSYAKIHREKQHEEHKQLHDHHD